MHRRIANLSFAFALALLPAPVVAQQAASAGAPRAQGVDLRLARVTALARLWGEVKYFHPYLAYRPIDWDSAFFAAYRAVNAAGSSAQYADAVQAFLDVLSDPATHIVRAREGPPTPVPTGAFLHRLPDSTLVVQFSALGDLRDYRAIFTRLDSVGQAIDKEQAVVLDLRFTVAGSNTGDDDNDVAAYFSQGWFGPAFDTHLISSPMTAPAQRARMYSGFPPQVGGTSGGYYSAFYSIDGDRLTPGAHSIAHRIVALVDGHSSVPSAVLALHAGGTLSIVAEGSAPSISGATTHSVDMGEDLTVQVRTSEPADESGMMHADTIFAVGGSTSDMVRAGLAVVERNAGAAGKRRPSTPAPPAVGQLERPYTASNYPDSALRVLAAARFWTAIHYFYPDKHLTGENWDAVLPSAIASLEQARDSLEYELAIIAMVRHIHDSHGFIELPIVERQLGFYQLPIRLRPVQGKVVITALLDTSAVRAGFRVGDVVKRIDGVETSKLVSEIIVPRAFSTPQSEAAARINAVRRATKGIFVTIAVSRGRGKDLDLRLAHLIPNAMVAPLAAPSPVYRLLPHGIGYADLTRLTVPQVDSMFAAFKGTRAIIFDMRGYPNGTAWAIAPRLADHPGKAAAIFRRPLRTTPDTTDRSIVEFSQTIPPTDASRYRGRTVMLIDDRAISQSEHTGLFLEAANGTKFIGSPTAGANGDVTDVLLPDSIVVHFSGHEVFHADGRQLQRLGLKPNIVVNPTITGLRAGKDEVLEAAVKYLSVP